MGLERGQGGATPNGGLVVKHWGVCGGKMVKLSELRGLWSVGGEGSDEEAEPLRWVKDLGSMGGGGKRQAKRNRERSGASV